MNDEQNAKHQQIEALVEKLFSDTKNSVYVAPLKGNRVDAILSIGITNEMRNGTDFLLATQRLQEFVMALTGRLGVKMADMEIAITKLETSIRFKY